ncbi:MAG: hypothetical protein IT337_04435 [Thermomicrobiales bacterium]|nr:hypothetical protein [Thermomicrobiales bacterium]
MERSAETPSPFQRAVAELCRQTAQWRRGKAEEYDRDARNVRTATALEELADHVLALPADDPRVRELQRLTGVGETFAPDQRVLYELGRFRFHHAEVGLDPFLDTLVELAVADRGEQGRFGGRMVPGDDPWG